jgi:hypothetical protein
MESNTEWGKVNTDTFTGPLVSTKSTPRKATVGSCKLAVQAILICCRNKSSSSMSLAARPNTVLGNESYDPLTSLPLASVLHRKVQTSSSSSLQPKWPTQCPCDQYSVDRPHKCVKLFLIYIWRKVKIYFVCSLIYEKLYYNKQFSELLFLINNLLISFATWQ